MGDDSYKAVMQEARNIVASREDLSPDTKVGAALNALEKLGEGNGGFYLKIHIAREGVVLTKPELVVVAAVDMAQTLPPGGYKLPNDELEHAFKALCFMNSKKLRAPDLNAALEMPAIANQVA